MHAERVDGFNPLAVIDCYRRKKAILEEEKDGPVLIDVLTYRYSGHSPSDASSYRTKEEVEAWEAEDCIAAYGKEPDRRRHRNAGRLGRHDQRGEGHHVRHLQTGYRRRTFPAYGPAQRSGTARHDDVLEPVDRLAVGR